MLVGMLRPCHAMPCHRPSTCAASAVPACHAMPCQPLECAAFACHAMPRPAGMPCLISSGSPPLPAEYNVLVHNNELYCIDVSQAVELDHPRAFDFLREGELAVGMSWRMLLPAGGCYPQPSAGGWLVSRKCSTSGAHRHCMPPMQHRPAQPPMPPRRLPARERLLPSSGGGHADCARAV